MHSFLAMQTIGMLGSEEQKQRWLPAMARIEKIGAFALTEPDHGSDSVGLETSARRSGDGYVLNGRKKWIGNASFADHVIVWARGEDGNVGGYVVAKGDARASTRPSSPARPRCAPRGRRRSSSSTWPSRPRTASRSATPSRTSARC